MARHKRKGSSKAGRPKKDGARYPNGRLKPPGPNEIVLARRKIGDASAGEHPLDFALSQKWLTEREHKDAMSYRAAYNRAHIAGPRLSCGSLCEVPPSDQLRQNWSQMSDAEVSEIFDRVFSGDPLPGDREALERKALELWKRLNAALSAQEREELFMVCVVGSWPFWMPKKAADHALGQKDTIKEAMLLAGLGAVGRALRPPRRRKGVVITSAPFRRTRHGRSELPVRYETEEGDEVHLQSERGMAFEVSILRKRA